MAKEGDAAAGSYLAMLLEHSEDAIRVGPIALFMLKLRQVQLDRK